MTRILYLTDTHLGADPMGYQQQPGYPERLPDLLAALQAWIAAHGDVDLVLHGGDIVDQCRPELIQEARSLFCFSVPVAVCLGNHDLTHPDAVSLWTTLAPEWFSSGPHLEIVRPDVVIHVVPNHWEERDYRWENRQEPALRPTQIGRIEDRAAAHPDRAHLLCTHSPLFGIPADQTGLDAPAHEPGAAFRNAVSGLLDRWPLLCFVLGGHNHVNTLVRRRGTLAVTCSSFVETPFEFKIVTVDGDRVSVETHNLADAAGFRHRYDYSRTYVQGRPRDRAGEVALESAPATQTEESR